MTRRLVLALGLALAGCAGAQVITETPPLNPQYRPQMLRAFDGALPLLVGGAGAGEAEALSAAMAGWIRGANLTYPLNGDTGASYGYRVVARIEGGRARSQDACAPDLPIRAGDSGGRTLTLAFCRGRTSFSIVSSALSEGAGFGEPGFQPFIRNLVAALFPAHPYDRNDGDDGEPWITF